MKKSFILYKDFSAQLDSLSVVQAGHLFKMIYARQCGNDYECDDPIVVFAMKGIENIFMRDEEKYSQTCAKRREAGSKGGKQKVANASKSEQTVANVADSDSDSDSGNESDSENEKSSCAVTSVPASDEESVLTFPCTGQPKQWQLTDKKLKEWEESFDTVAVLTECRRALQWIRDNPTKKKTARGMTKFIGSWLSRAANSPRQATPQPATYQSTPGMVDLG